MRPSENLKQQDISQAVVIADKFDKKFSPLTDSGPLVLFPVGNMTLLECILQSLERSHIKETYIFCCSHSQQIRNYVSSSRWSNGTSAMSVNVVSSTTFLSMGDMMRELDSKAIIRSDFILIDGPVITNFPLHTMLEKHKKLRQTDKDCALTMLYRKALPTHRTRCKEHNLFVAVESNSQRIRYFQRVNKLKTLHIPLVVFQENDEVNLHYDLLDSHIGICSPCVPLLFSDNFDYQTMDDFIKGLISNEELLGNSMYIDIAEKGYGACISNFYMYDAVSQDIISRWTHPYVPDLFDSRDQKYSHAMHNIYKEKDTEIGRNCKLLQNVVIGKGSRIGENTVISNSVIGKNCVIGENAVIKGAYIWDNSTVGDECKLDTCLLGEGVKLFKKVVVNPGCVLGSKVIIDDGVTIPSCTKLQSHVPVDEVCFGFDDFDTKEKEPQEKANCNRALVGQRGLGYLVPSNKDSEDSDDEAGEEDEDSPIEDVWGKKDDPEEHIEDEEDYRDETSSSEIPSPDEDMSEDSDCGEGFDDEANFFYKEVFDSLKRGLEEKVKSENMILEINSSKHAYNVTMKEVNTLIIRALLKIPLEGQKEEITPLEYLSAIKPSLQFFKPLIANYIKSAESQMDCLFSLEEFMKSHETMSPAVMKVIHFWYDQDLLSEPVILKWYSNISSENERIKKLASAFVKWLQEADEESSDDDDDDE